MAKYLPRAQIIFSALAACCFSILFTRDAPIHHDVNMIWTSANTNTIGIGLSEDSGAFADDSGRS